MSCRTNSKTRSANDDHRRGTYLRDDSLDDDFEALRSDAAFLEDEDFDAPDLPGVLRRHTSAGSDPREPASWEPPGLSFALSERLGLLKTRIDTLLKEGANRRRLHRTVQKAVQGELRELQHLLDEVKVWSLGVSPSVDGRRTNLEREAISLKKTAWQERLRHWRDLVWLEKELQQALERYKLAAAARGLTEIDPHEEND